MSILQFVILMTVVLLSMWDIHSDLKAICRELEYLRDDLEKTPMWGPNIVHGEDGDGDV